MKIRKFRGLIGLGSGLLALFSTALPAQLNVAVVSSAQAQDVSGRTVQALLNEYRASKGLGPLRLDANLTAMAQSQANAMLARRTLSHDVAGGFLQRLGQFGISPVRASENLGSGYRSEQSAFQRWRNSPVHDADMLIPELSRMGLAVARDSSGASYWALDMSDQ